jgi:acyl-CoA thioester hydrolase
METFFTLERTDEPGITCAEGGATMVWMDFATGRSVPMPDWLRQAACPAAD